MAERMRSPPRFPGLFISNIVFTDTQLGAGSDATVFEVNWNGTMCAAKRLHQILLEDQSPGGAEKLISNFEAEYITWSKLRHPGVVQFLGVYLERNSRLPVLVMEKMDTSLRRYLEDHRKTEFPLHLKAFVLRQISQALAYLHGRNPPLVHHDLSPNNVLLNVVSFTAKLTDFGMSRAINPSVLSRKSSIKGTLAFMAPEALHNPPRYNETLDVFSFGNIILSTLTHEWPNPGPPNRNEGDELVALNELQRRVYLVETFTAQEKHLFLPTVRQCLENRPDKRPSSALLVRDLRRIELSLPAAAGGHVSAPIIELRQQLSAKEEECRQMNQALRGKDETLAEKEEALLEQDIVIKVKDEALQHLDMTIREKDEALTEKTVTLKEKDSTIKAQQTEMEQLHQRLLAKEEEIRQRDVALREKDTIEERQYAIQQQQSSIQAQHTAIRNQPESDAIPVQRAKSKYLKIECAAVAQQAPVKHPPRDWRNHGACLKVIQHCTGGGGYRAVAVSIEGLLAVTDGRNTSVHLFTKQGALVRSVGKGVLGVSLFGVSFDLKGNIWVTDCNNHRVVKLSQKCGRVLQTIEHASSERDRFSDPTGVSVSPEGLMYICDRSNHRVTVHDEQGRFLFAFGSEGSGRRCFDKPNDIAFSSDGLVYVVDYGNERVCVWCKEGTFQRDFKPKYAPYYIAATSDNHLLITSCSCHNVMVYTLEGDLIHQFGEKGSNPGRFSYPCGMCVDGNELVYVVDKLNKRVQVF